MTSSRHLGTTAVLGAAVLALVAGGSRRGGATGPAPRIVSSELEAASLRRLGVDAVVIMVHARPGSRLGDWLEGRGLALLGRGVAGDTERFLFSVPVERAPELAQAIAREPGIEFVERVHRIGLLDGGQAGSVQSGAQGTGPAETPIWLQGLRGEGQIIAVLDTGLDADSCYFDDPTAGLPVVNTWSAAAGYGTAASAHRKVVAYDFLFSCDQHPTHPGCELPGNAQAWDTNGHGTHVAGNVAGDSDGLPGHHAMADGLAPAAKLVVQDGGFGPDACGDLPGIGCPVIDLFPVFDQARRQGASIHNNSYGDNENVSPPAGNYSARSQDVDRFMRAYPEFLIVYAAGNSGGKGDFSVLSPATNKNGLAVASARTAPAAQRDDLLSGFSSRGWTVDGRVKPDVVAPGCNVAAGNNGSVAAPACANNAGCGTSYAAPVAAAAAALVRQYFTEGFYPTGSRTAGHEFTPTAALLKAMLINSALPMAGVGPGEKPIRPIPSPDQGWGRIQLDRVLRFGGGLFVHDVRVAFDAQAGQPPVSYVLTGVEPGEPLKVTIAWTDAPGSPDSPLPGAKHDDPSTWADAQLVNDLDLVVEGPDGSYLGNVFQEGVSVMGGDADRRNNVEQVLLPSPTAGDYVIRVLPTHVRHRTQGYAIVVTGRWHAAP